MTEKAGEIAGRIWNALNGSEGMTLKEIKTAAKLKEKEDVEKKKVELSEVEEGLEILYHI